MLLQHFTSDQTIVPLNDVLWPCINVRKLIPHFKNLELEADTERRGCITSFFGALSLSPNHAVFA